MGDAKAIAKYHAERASYGGASREFHTLAETYIRDAATRIDTLETRLAEVERERDEAQRQVAALTEGLRLVSDALARLDQIYRADTDLGDPPVETPAWLQEAQHRAAALLAPATPAPRKKSGYQRALQGLPRRPSCEDGGGERGASHG